MWNMWVSWKKIFLETVPKLYEKYNFKTRRWIHMKEYFLNTKVTLRYENTMFLINSRIEISAEKFNFQIKVWRISSINSGIWTVTPISEVS